MILIDANLLLYAYDSSSPHHERAQQWLSRVLSRPEPVSLAWVTVLAFLRIATNPRAFENPLSISAAVGIVSEWLARPMVRIISPGTRHWEIFAELLLLSQSRGPLVMDAHLAALALEHGLVVYTNDRDFTRFPRLRTVNPLDIGF